MVKNTPAAATPDEEIEPTPIPVFAEAKVPSTKPPFMVVGDSLIAQTENGELSFRMAFKTKLVRQMPDFADDLAMLFYLFTAQQKLLDALDDLDIIDSREIATKFFQAFSEKQGARLGE